MRHPASLIDHTSYTATSGVPVDVDDRNRRAEVWASR